MKASSFTQAVVATALTMLAVGMGSTAQSQTQIDAHVSIGSGRPVYRDYDRRVYYEPRRSPLVIVLSPRIVVNRYHDGRYYYRNPSGYYYWRGRDNRYYLDERYLRDVSYDDRAYRDWSCDHNYYRNDRKKYKHRGHGHGHGRNKHDRYRDYDDD